MVFDLIDGETRQRSWRRLKKGGVLVTTLADPSQELANEHGVRATRYTVQADGEELSEIAGLVTSGKVQAHVQKAYPLRSAVEALASVEEGHSVGKVVLVLDPSVCPKSQDRADRTSYPVTGLDYAMPSVSENGLGTCSVPNSW
jgi:D-arabinose 1-dehydrogenase-like Zn-dependent alcohol dehydrogenase